MTKKILLFFLSALLLAGCGTAQPEGIYYPASSHVFIGNTLQRNKYSSACYSDTASSLYYDDSIYTSVRQYMEYSKSDLPLPDLLGEELAPVYGNQGQYWSYWSVTEEKLAECTTNGTLYQLKGYDEDFRVCLYYEVAANPDAGHGPLYCLSILERTNHLTLYNGEDYFTSLFHFPTEATLNDLSIDDPEVSAFVDALLQAELISPDTPELPDFDKEENFYYVSFTDSLGLTNAFQVYEDGYVVDKEDHNFIFRLDPALCTAIIDKIHTPEWTGTYLHNTYTYDETYRTQHYYRMDITETDTHMTFDLEVKENSVRLRQEGTPIDTPSVTGPVSTITFSKEELGQKHTLTFSMPAIKDGPPELLIYVELVKGTEDDMISMRYALTEEELAQKEYIILKRQQ